MYNTEDVYGISTLFGNKAWAKWMRAFGDG